MNKNNNKSSLPELPNDLKTADPEKIKGLTIREIRHRRALVLLQKEFCKEKISYSALKLKNSSPFSRNYNGRSRRMGRFPAIIGKLVGGMNYLDYAVIGFSVFNNVRKVFSLFKRR